MKHRWRVLGVAFFTFFVAGSFSVHAETPSWTVVKDQSFISFAGTQTGNPFEGRFETFEVDIQFDPNEPASAQVSASIDSGSALTGDTQRDEALPGKDWFNIVEFPSISFRASGFQKIGPNDFITDGVLTVLGVDHSLSLPFQLTIEGTQARMEADITLDRQILGIGKGPWAEGKWVGLDVNVKIRIQATRATP